ncbi:MAG TPA: alpha/beta fold hydrolase [Solirubrobacteraceae bacterium]|nr:alpha/beta fold hydrolase [Solirubrobacteraceae bacterium]
MAIAPDRAAPSAANADDGYGPIGRSEWMDIDWREHLRWVRVHRRWVNCVDIGEGPPLVFVHGLSGSWQNWLENIPHFARTHRVIVPDLPGFGCSQMPSEKISINGYARWLDELCARLELESTDIVGNSMGGFVAAEFALAFPQRVKRLALVSAAGISTEQQRNERMLVLLRKTEFVAIWLAGKTERAALRPGLRRFASFIFRHPERLPGPLIVEQARGGGKPGFIDALDACTSYPLRERLSQISCPTLIVWGDSDRLVPLRDADVFEALIDGSRKLVYADTGHVPQLERPARFNRDVERHLA